MTGASALAQTTLDDAPIHTSAAKPGPNKFSQTGPNPAKPRQTAKEKAWILGLASPDRAFSGVPPTPQGVFSLSFLAAAGLVRMSGLERAPASASPSGVLDHGKAEIGGDAVELVEQLLARLGVVDLGDLAGPLVAVEPVEHFEERRYRPDVARRPPRSPPASPAGCATRCSLAWSVSSSMGKRRRASRARSGGPARAVTCSASAISS